MASVRKTLYGDHLDLVDNLRAADLVELRAHNVTPESALRLGYEYSEPCMTILHKRRPIGMFGVTPIRDIERAGSVWLLGSDEISDIRIQFLRESQKWLIEIAKDYSMLCNVVHEDNVLHHRWLRYLQFRKLRHCSPFFEFARIV